MFNTDNACLAVDLGLIDYEEAFALQRRLVTARKAGVVPDLLLLCQHPHVITLGRSARREHLLGTTRVLAERGVTVCESDRGGDVTYHGPGQLVGYPILNLAGLRKDVAWYVRQLEKVIIAATADCGVVARRVEGKTGVWVDRAQGETEKLAAIGVHLSRWVTSHGFAYNISTDLSYFDLIVPCGIAGCRAVSLDKLLGRASVFPNVSQKIVSRFGELFGLKMRHASREELESQLVSEKYAAPGLAASHA